MINNGPLPDTRLLIAYFLFLCGTFVGDFSVFSIPAMWPIWIAAVFFMPGLWRHEHLRVVFCLALLFAPSLILNFDYQRYYFLCISALMYVYVLATFTAVYRSLGYVEFPLFVFSLTFLAAFYAIPVEYETSNTRIFGPNIQYRLYALVYLVYLISFVKARQLGSSIPLLRPIIILVAAVLSILLTGSRTGLMVAAMCCGLSVAYLYRSGGRWKVALLSLGGFGVVYGLMGVIREVFFRSFYLDVLNDQSMGVRFLMFRLVDRFWDSDVLGLLFGWGPENPVFPFYPHNFFLELLVYWGGIATLAVGVIIFVVCFRASSPGVDRDLCVVFSPLFVGVLASGDLSDNYPVVTFLVFIAFCAARPASRRQRLRRALIPKNEEDGSELR